MEIYPPLLHALYHLIGQAKEETEMIAELLHGTHFQGCTADIA